MSIDRRKLKRIPAKMLSIAAMFAAFTLVSLYLSVIFPNMKFTFYFLSSIFVSGVLVEGLIGMGFAVYGVAAVISVVIMPIPYALPYVILFGHYGIGKYFLETRIKSRLAAFILKLIYFDIALAGVHFAVIFTGLLPMTDMFSSLPVWAWALIAQPVFIAYDFLYSKITGVYVNTIRNRIVKGS